MATSPKLKFRASDAHRWTDCLASVREEARRPKEENAYATDGIVFHEIIEPYTKRLDPMYVPGCPIPVVGSLVTVDGVEHEVTDEHITNVDQCLDYLSMIIEQIPHERFSILTEVKVDYGTWTVDGQIGYIDVVIIDRANRVLHILDTKYGKGIEVYAVKNAQESLYALGAIQQLGIFEETFESVELHIMQPRRDHFDKWVTTEDELNAWGAETKAIADRIIASDDLPFNPAGKTCRFCKAKSDCRALAEGALSTVSAGFENIVESFDAIDKRTAITLREVPPLTPEEIFNVYHNIDMVRVFLKAIEGRAYGLYRGGNAPENNGCKLVHGKTNRVWLDEKKADAAIGRQKIGDKKIDSKTRREPWKLKSPAKIEKLIGKDHKIMQTHVDKPPGAPTLVLLSDKRPAINVVEDAVDGFVGAEEGSLTEGDVQYFPLGEADLMLDSSNLNTEPLALDGHTPFDKQTDGQARMDFLDKDGEIVGGLGFDKDTGEMLKRDPDNPRGGEPCEFVDIPTNVAAVTHDPSNMAVTEERDVGEIGGHFLDEAFDDSDYQKIKPVSLFDEADNE